MNDVLNKNLISKHEGNRMTAYRDTRGFLTIGRGFNLDAPNAMAICYAAGINYAAVRAGCSITLAESDAIFESQYSLVAAEARKIFPEIDTYPEGAAAVICDMLFELGLAGFEAFKVTIAAFRAKDWPAAIAGIQDSALDRQVPAREAENMQLLRNCITA